MDYELVLDYHFERIKQDLDVYEIKDFLEGILSKSDARSIFNRGESKDDNITRAERLLNLFRRRLQSHIPNLIEELKNSYPELAENFLNDLKKIRDIDQLPTTKKHIRRVKQLNEILRHLRERTKFVVISGMSGLGKTNLAVEAAMHFALQKSVYWVNAGGSSGSQLKVLRSLLSRVEPMQEDTNSQSDPAQLIRKLQTLLKSDDVVILDNVTAEVDISILTSLLSAFIITTPDTGITEYLDSFEKVDMSEGFTKEESLELISKVVQKDVHSLPQCVVDLHKYFRGYPLAVTMIASQLNRCHENFWAQYCEFSSDSDKSKRRRSSDGYKSVIDNTLEKCIQSLSPENQDYYKMLAIFKDNVFLTTEMLTVLWNCPNVQTVRDILNELEDKSMVIKNRKVSLNTDVYEVHSTVLNYLRRIQCGDDEEGTKRIHQDFVRNYIDKYKNIANLKDDHYIYFYILYHIISAGYLEDFKEQLFTLDYIMAKLVACGPNDMAEDLKLYKNDLEKAGFDKHRLEQTLKFSERFGWDIYHTKVTDLQFFLQLSDDSILFKEAMERCKESKKIVLKNKWLTPQINTIDYPFQISVKKLYCLDQNEILCEKWVGDKPSIILAKLGDVKEIPIANGSILSICTVKGQLLYKDKTRAYMKQVGGGRTPDASRQVNGDRSIWKTASIGTNIRELDNISIAAFSQNGDKIAFATSSEQGVYDLEKGSAKKIQKSKIPIPDPIICCFCSVNNSEVVMYATSDKNIYFYETSSVKPITSYTMSSKIIDMTPVPGKMKLLIITEFSVEILSWEHGPQTMWLKSSQNGLSIGSLSLRRIYDGPKKCSRSFATDKWIGIATNDGCLVTRNTAIIGEKFFNVGYWEVAALDIVGNTLTMVTSRGGACEKDSNSQRRITVHDLERGDHRPYLTDARQLWPIQKGYLLAVVEPDCVVFFKDNRRTFETVIDKPLTVDVSQMGEIAVVGDANGNVHYILPFKNKKLDKVTNLEGRVDFIKISDNGDFVVAACTLSDHCRISVISMSTHKPLETVDTTASLFDCFFEEEIIPSKVSKIKGESKMKVILVLKNGRHAVYDSSLNKYDLGYDYYDWSILSCVAYQNRTLIKGVENNLHLIDLDSPKLHNSKDFGHRITSCCFEPVESATMGDSTNPCIAVALSTDDQRFQVVICTKDLNELRTIELDYAQEEITQLVFSKSQMILMGRGDWLCFWDASRDSTGSTKTSRSTLHPAWKTKPLHYLDEHQLVARFKLQLEVLSLLPSEDFGTFAVVHKKGDRRLLNVVDYNIENNIRRNGSLSSLHLNLRPKNGSL